MFWRWNRQERIRNLIYYLRMRTFCLQLKKFCGGKKTSFHNTSNDLSTVMTFQSSKSSQGYIQTTVSTAAPNGILKNNLIPRCIHVC
jgi:hypothetical protein